MKNIFQKIDKPLFLLTILYIVLGLIMILSASSVAAVLRYNVASYYFFVKQALFVGVALLISIFLILRIPTNNYRFPAYLYIIGIIAALFGLIVYGQISNGAQSWYKIGFISIQPSEFAKTAIIIFMAIFYNRSLEIKKGLWYNLIPLGIAILIFVLILMEPDLGGALIVAFITFFLFIKIPLPKDGKIKLIKFVGITLIAAGIAIINFGGDLINSSQLDRLTFKNPCSRYTESTGYQVCNGFIAIHNGGLFGVGLGNSTQKYLYLPEAHTDFIFPILVEELGLIAGIAVLLGYALILYRILKIAKGTTDLRGFILSYGTFLYILAHLIVNLLGILAIIPLTGVPIPFLSYGSSYNVNLIIMIFIVQRVAVENKLKDEKRKRDALV